jgi:type IV pilus assembly protein PilY1
MLAGLCAGPAQAQLLNLAQTPLYLGSTVKPNVLVVYDNSQSMDGTMSGRLIAGDDASTRGNIARSVLRDTITSYRGAFQWGLASFGLVDAPAWYRTYAYYFGSNTQVVYTNDCVNGVSLSNGGLRCVTNPQNGNGFQFLTYGLSGDDASINDVLYIGADFGQQLYGIGVTGSTDYDVYLSHASAAGNWWSAGSFTGGQGRWNFTPTDAGFLPQTPPYSRMFWLRRAWGYLNSITGTGVINQPVAADSTTQFNALMTRLAAETSTAGSAELKNAAVFTPLAGTLQTAASYYGNTLTGQSTPISQTCQRSFVLLATDGNPTGRLDGTMYTLAEQASTFSATTGQWTFSQAANDVFSQIGALRTLSISNSATVNGRYDIQTYVIGLGDTVANATSIAVLNRMASLGGTSQAYLANDRTSLAAALQRISTDILARTSGASAVTLNGGAWNTGSEVYQARFNSADWSGQLLAYSLDSSGNPAATPRWDAGQRLNLQHWSTGRQILTYRGANALGQRGVPFRWPVNPATPTSTEIDTAWVTALNTGLTGVADTLGSQRLAYLRGDTSRETRNAATGTTPLFRNRAVSVLGDIVNSAPVYVKSGGLYLRDAAEAQSYATYRATRAAMTPMIYVGANDGMLHGFSALTGSEVFAYVPALVASRVSALTDPAYAHRYSVDGSPVVSDVYYGGAWHTVLVAGLAGGGKGLFALDVSDPSRFTEAQASRVVRWEIGGSDADMGHIFHKPVIAKLKNGRWMALVGNGYNSSSGTAVLMAIDLETGSVTRIGTGAGSTSTPNGLSGVVAISTANNGMADMAYAGDLAGNLWRFDLSSSNPAEWHVAYGPASNPRPLFSAESGQAITALPDVTPHPKGGYMVVFGTGRYVDVGDGSTTTTQAVYGIWDQGQEVSASHLVTQSVLGTATGADARSYRFTTFAVGTPSGTSYSGDDIITSDQYLANKRGWKLVLPLSGERVVAQAIVRYGRVILTTMIPSTLPCTYGGDGWIMEVDPITGNRPDTPALDTNADNTVDTADKLLLQGSAANVSGVRIGSIGTAPTLIRARDRKLDDKLVNTSAGSLVRIRETGSGQRSGRAGWEQLQ